MIAVDQLLGYGPFKKHCKQQQLSFYTTAIQFQTWWGQNAQKEKDAMTSASMQQCSNEAVHYCATLCHTGPTGLTWPLLVQTSHEICQFNRNGKFKTSWLTSSTAFRSADMAAMLQHWLKARVAHLHIYLKIIQLGICHAISKRSRKQWCKFNRTCKLCMVTWGQQW